MPKKKAFDGSKLIKMVEDGAHQSDIKKKFGFRTSAQVTLAYAKAQMEAGKIPPIKGGRGSGKYAVGKEVRVGKRGSIIIPAEMVAELKVGGSDKFAVRKTRAGIALRKIGK
jgi:ABC-type proline/glycine betaine transport system ATPase subunit